MYVHYATLVSRNAHVSNCGVGTTAEKKMWKVSTLSPLASTNQRYHYIYCIEKQNRRDAFGWNFNW